MNSRKRLQLVNLKCSIIPVNLKQFKTFSDDQENDIFVNYFIFQTSTAILDLRNTFFVMLHQCVEFFFLPLASIWIEGAQPTIILIKELQHCESSNIG